MIEQSQFVSRYSLKSIASELLIWAYLVFTNSSISLQVLYIKKKKYISYFVYLYLCDIEGFPLQHIRQSSREINYK